MAPAERSSRSRKVHNPGDRVRVVLRGRTVAEHLDAAPGDGGDGREIRPLGPEGDPVPAVPVDHGGPVAALAVDENQGVVRRQIAQHCRAHQGRGVADRLGIHGERRDRGAEPLIDGGRSLAQQVFRTDRVDGDG